MSEATIEGAQTSGPLLANVRVATRDELEVALASMVKVLTDELAKMPKARTLSAFELGRLNDASDILTAILAHGVEVRSPVDGFWYWPSQAKVGQVAEEQRAEREAAQARAQGQPVDMKPTGHHTYMAGENTCLCTFGKKGSASLFCKHMLLTRYLNVAVASVAQAEDEQAKAAQGQPALEWKPVEAPQPASQAQVCMCPDCFRTRASDSRACGYCGSLAGPVVALEVALESVQETAPGDSPDPAKAEPEWWELTQQGDEVMAGEVFEDDGEGLARAFSRPGPATPASPGVVKLRGDSPDMEGFNLNLPED